jgi:pimeloyl-ACP methyl ester carboxylesterase
MNFGRSQFPRRKFLTSVGIATAGAVIATDVALANRRAPTHTRGYAPWKHGLVHFYDTMTDGLPLVLLHQAPMSARQFESVYLPLAQRGIRAIGIDTPGFGVSDVTPFVPTIADWVPAIVAVLDHLGVRKSAALGHHTGALLATELGLVEPTRIGCVIINGPSPINDEERKAGLARVDVRERQFEYKKDGSHLAQSFMGRFNTYGSDADPQLITRYIVEKFQGFGPFWYGHHAAYQYDHAAALKRLKLPTLLLTNTGDQLYEMALRARALRPDFDFFELQGGGVDVVDQQPAAWSDAVATFVSKHANRLGYSR